MIAKPIFMILRSRFILAIFIFSACVVCAQLQDVDLVTGHTLHTKSPNQAFQRIGRLNHIPWGIPIDGIVAVLP